MRTVSTLLAIFSFCNFMVVIARVIAEICPVSSAVTGPLTSGLHTYPVDVYKPSLLNRTQENSEQINYNCTSREIFGEDPQLPGYYVCSTSNICPVHMQNVHDALNRSSGWISDKNLCNIRRHFSNRTETINVIILGGSVTFGAKTSGYACTSNFDSKCPTKNNRLHHEISWSKYLLRWMKLKYKAKIKIHDFSIPGQNSMMMAEMIDQRLAESNLKTLKETDLIFIDHSINDGLEAHYHFAHKLHKGLELLVRKLYSYSEAISRPKLILLEMLQFNTHGSVCLYKPAYTNISMYYNIPIWSYSDAALSSYTEKYQPIYYQYLRNTDNILGENSHCGWHIHLFYADLIGAIMQTLSKNCPLMPSKQDSPTFDIPIAINSDLDSIKYCLRGEKPYLNIPTYDIWQNKTENVIGSWDIVPANSWRLVEEKRGRVGWVKQDDSIGELRFQIEANSDIFHNGNVNGGDNNNMIQLKYLSSYEKVGRANVSVCGQHVAVIDALWSDYKTHRYSYPEIVRFFFSIGDDNSKPGEVAIAAAGQSRSVVCPMNKPIEIVVKHVYDSVPCGSSDGVELDSCNDMKTARGALQKFKLVSMKVCKYS